MYSYFLKIWTALKRAQPVFQNVETTWNPSRMSPANCSVQVEIIGLLKYDHFEILLSAQCNEDNYCSFWSFQEHMDTAEKRCFLMQVKFSNTQTTSHDNECLCVCLIVVIGKCMMTWWHEMSCTHYQSRELDLVSNLNPNAVLWKSYSGSLPLDNIERV